MHPMTLDETRSSAADILVPRYLLVVLGLILIACSNSSNLFLKLISCSSIRISVVSWFPNSEHGHSQAEFSVVEDNFVGVESVSVNIFEVFCVEGDKVGS